MNPGQLSLLDAPVARVRRHDPPSAKAAAADHTVARAHQWKALLRRLHDGPISADTAGTLIGRHRSIASTRLGVLIDRGLVERGGDALEPPADGGPERKVLLYRLTPAGEAEYGLLFGGVS